MKNSLYTNCVLEVEKDVSVSLKYLLPASVHARIPLRTILDPTDENHREDKPTFDILGTITAA